MAIGFILGVIAVNTNTLNFFITAIVPMLAAGFGAWAAFAYQNRKDRKNRIAEIYELSIYEILNLRKIRSIAQSVYNNFEPEMNSPNKHITFPVEPKSIRSLKIPFQMKDYLFLSKINNLGAVVLVKCEFIHSKFETLLDVLEIHSHIAKEEIPSAMKALNKEIGDNLNINDMDKQLGSVTVIELKTAIDSIINTTIEILEESKNLDALFNKAIKQNSPEFTLLEIDVKKEIDSQSI